MTNNILLIHGAWHTGSCWNEMKAILEKEGYNVYTPTYPGNSPDDSKDVKSEDYFNWLIDQINAIPGKVIVFGHSSAGIIMSGSLFRIPEKIELAIFNNAFIPPNNMSQFDCIEQEVQDSFRAIASERDDNCVPMSPDFMRTKLMQLCNQEVFDRVMAEEIVPQPLTIFETKAASGKLSDSDIPCAMVHFTDDVSVPKDFYKTMFQSLGRGEIVEIPGEHEAILSEAEKTAKALLSLIK